MEQTAQKLPTKNIGDKPLDESAVEALEMAFQDEIIDSNDKPQKNSASKFIQYLIIVFVVILVSTVGLFVYNEFTKPNDFDAMSGSSHKGYSPILNSDDGQVYRGKIFITQENLSDKFKYELLDERGNLIVYLYSETIDLDIARGLNIGIKGVPDIETFEGVEVINVKEVEFQ